MAGSTGRGRGRGHLGRGRSRDSRVPRSPSPEEEECPYGKYFESVVLINDDPFGKKKLPDKFTKFLVAGSLPR
jgi:hypothetical protein